MQFVILVGVAVQLHGRLADGAVVSLAPAAVSPSSVVEVWVERLKPALGEDFGWTRDLDAVDRLFERLRQDAASEADEVFTPARLDKQRSAILDRLEKEKK